MTAPTGGVAGSGHVTRVDSDRLQRAAASLEARTAAASVTGAHVWIVSAAFSLTEDTARAMVAGTIPQGVLLDLENLVHMAPGCYACEEPLSPRLLARRCRGDVPAHR